ncbi:unnamed protein product [Ilex paraguariensis]|uniref:Cytosolic endo-beta-N-acetylglucosaminidase C-terminal domain-containing protein n=1 Tax=Ilex paraguariensis TaxID=185542 RepID=A0ABC8T4Z9_9AQUA
MASPGLGGQLLGSSIEDVDWVKTEGNSMLGLYLQFSFGLNGRKTVLLASSGNTLLTMNQFSSQFSDVIMPHRVMNQEKAPGWVIQESSIAMNGYVLTEIHAVCYKAKPGVTELRLESDSVGENNTTARGPSEYYAVLGSLTVKTSSPNSDFPPSSLWLVEGQDIEWTSGSQGSKILSVKVVWKLKHGNASLFPNYNIYVEKLANQSVANLGGVVDGVQEYIGVALVQAFYVSDLVVPSGTSSLKFIIQVCASDGTCQKLDDSPFLQLHVEGS